MSAAAVSARSARQLLLFGAALLIVYTASVAIVASEAFAHRAEPLSLAVTLDLTLVVPVLYWLTVIRTGKLPAITVIPVLLLSLFGASLVLPDRNQRWLDLAELMVGPAELGALGYIAFKVRQVRRRFRGAGAGDFLDRVRDSVRAALPGVGGVADLFAHEVALPYYAFAWRARPGVRDGEIAFAYHQCSAFPAILAALILVTVGEAFAVHLLLSLWSATVAWVFTALSAYGLVWLTALRRSLVLRPTVMARDVVTLRVGLLWSVRVPYDRIVSITVVRGASPDRKTPEYFAAAPLGGVRWILELSESVEAEGPYGYRRAGIRRVGVNADDHARFEAELRERTREAC